MASPQAMIYCGICAGWGTSIPEVRYMCGPGYKNFERVIISPGKDCPGCDGTGVSELAKRQMAELEKNAR